MSQIRKDKQMKFWTPLFSIVVIVCCSSSVTVAQSATGPKAGSAFASLPKITPEIARWLMASSRSYKLSKAGDDFAKQGDWQNAQDNYQKALDEFPTNPDALYGLGECSRIAGDIAQEVEYDRKALYSSRTGKSYDDGFQTSDTVKLMKFAILLSQAGYADEARTVYHHAAGLLNYMDGKQNIPIMLPAFGLAPGQLPYTPRRLQALAQVGITFVTRDGEDDQAHLAEAIRLQPDLALAYFYKGKALSGRPGSSRATRDALRAAARYGDAGMRAEVDKLMKADSVEGNAQVEQDLEDQHRKQAAPKK